MEHDLRLERRHRYQELCECLPTKPRGHGRWQLQANEFIQEHVEPMGMEVCTQQEQYPETCLIAWLIE